MKIELQVKSQTKIERYTVKFNNGYWKVFDRELYQDVSLEFLKKDVVDRCNRMNSTV